MGASRILSRLRHKGQITEEEYRKMMDIKNSERHTQKVIEDIRTEIKKMDTLITRSEVLEVIDKCIKGE